MKGAPVGRNQIAILKGLIQHGEWWISDTGVSVGWQVQSTQLQKVALDRLIKRGLVTVTPVERHGGGGWLYRPTPAVPAFLAEAIGPTDIPARRGPTHLPVPPSRTEPQQFYSVMSAIRHAFGAPEVARADLSRPLIVALADRIAALPEGEQRFVQGYITGRMEALGEVW